MSHSNTKPRPHRPFTQRGTQETLPACSLLTKARAHWLGGKHLFAQPSPLASYLMTQEAMGDCGEGGQHNKSSKDYNPPLLSTPACFADRVRLREPPPPPSQHAPRARVANPYRPATLARWLASQWPSMPRWTQSKNTLIQKIIKTNRPCWVWVKGHLAGLWQL